MLRLVNNLLDLRRIESGAEQLQPAPIQLDRVLQIVWALARLRAAEKQLVTTLWIEPDLPALCTDELLLRRAVDNLLSNAIKYTPAGETVRLAASRSGDGIEISVSDTGIGLTEEEKQRLFERFFRSTRPEARQERGTGLGLALVRESVRRLGGEITVNSQVGKGSTFTLWIPPLPRSGQPAVAALP
jgi:signal transduction histidine kinase